VLVSCGEIGPACLVGRLPYDGFGLLEIATGGGLGEAARLPSILPPPQPRGRHEDDRAHQADQDEIDSEDQQNPEPAMRARGLIAVLAVLAVACSLLLGAGPAALGKENVKARLLTPLRLDVSPGEKLTVVWALSGADEHGRRLPFNAIGVFIRLLSASGGGSTVGFATPDAHPQGRYDAQVAVPEGGIGGVQIGLRGSSDIGASDTLFPLENDPFAAPARQGGTGQEAPTGNPLPRWLVLAGALALLGVLGAVVWRARWRTAPS
jgi:hypothetical protein